MSSFRPHVVLYEWNLRNSVGTGLARSIRGAAVGTGPMVIALSTLDEPEGFRLSEEIDGYLTKPFQVELLDAFVTKAALVGGRRSLRERHARSK